MTVAMSTQEAAMNMKLNRLAREAREQEKRISDLEDQMEKLERFIDHLEQRRLD